jgi:hypothetical protein
MCLHAGSKVQDLSHSRFGNVDRYCPDFSWSEDLDLSRRILHAVIYDLYIWAYKHCYIKQKIDSTSSEVHGMMHGAPGL